MDLNCVQVVMIAPTREIAVQGARAVLDVAKGEDWNELKVHTFIGGMSINDDIVKAKKCHIAGNFMGLKWTQIRPKLDLKCT